MTERTKLKLTNLTFKMYLHLFFTIFLLHQSASQTVHEMDVHFRVEPGDRTCFFEQGKAGQMMEAQYQVIDGQHGDLDISFDIFDPDGTKLVSDYKKPYNSIIMELSVDGEYIFCMDNTFSVMNSKLVFVYVSMENKTEEATTVAVDKGDKEDEEILEWMGTYDNGEPYYIEVTQIADTLTRTLKHVVKARHLLDIYGVMKSRDSYLAFEDTFIVDVWSGCQISLMFVVGLVQVYMIKSLFNRPASVKSIY